MNRKFIIAQYLNYSLKRAGLSFPVDLYYFWLDWLRVNWYSKVIMASTEICCQHDYFVEIRFEAITKYLAILLQNGRHVYSGNYSTYSYSKGGSTIRHKAYSSNISLKSRKCLLITSTIDITRRDTRNPRPMAMLKHKIQIFLEYKVWKINQN